jgi:ketosteroid isomerase-like protein
MPEHENLRVVRLAVERWNAGDLEGVLELYAEDISMHAGPDWPEQRAWHGLEGARQSLEEWRDVWRSSEIEVDSLESHGKGVIGTGAWNTRGRASGAGGRMPFVVLLIVRDGRIPYLEWFTVRDKAVATARAA